MNHPAFSSFVKTIYFILLISIFNIGCNESENKNIRNGFLNDLEGYEGWIGISGYGNLITTDAHSGSHCEKTDSSNNFSITFQRKFQELSSTPIKRFSMSVWVKCFDNTAKGSYILSIENGAEVIKYYSFDLNEKNIVPNQWVQIKGEADMPAVQPKDANIRIYFWNKTAAPILVDDLAFSYEN